MPIEFVLPLAPAGTGSAVERVARAPRDEAIVAAAAVVTAQHGLLRQVRVAVGGAHPQPIRLPTIEAMLDGQPYSAELLQRAEVTIVNEAQPVADFRASADYRRAMGGVLARRALTAAWQQATA
jgi:carbon-monoxide dehydrogenase medium subunit